MNTPKRGVFRPLKQPKSVRDSLSLFSTFSTVLKEIHSSLHFALHLLLRQKAEVQIERVNLNITSFPMRKIKR
jgi:hypothetical protein